MGKTPDIKQQLKKFSIFDGLTAHERSEIAPLISRRGCVEKELVFDEGDRSDEIFLVNAGVFGVSVQSNNEEVSVASFSEGDIFGEMAFFDRHPRSAACRAEGVGQVLILDHKTFSLFQKRHPEVCAKILKSLYRVITYRLRNSDSFLSDMVQWGEAARKRSITDVMTGLFNRRYFDDFLDTSIFDAYVNGTDFIMVMMDIDSFGDINRDLGSALADECIVIFAEAIKATLRDADTATRYGGDEFIAVLPQTTIDEATDLCAKLRAELVGQLKQANPKLRAVSLTVSQGIASFPHHAKNKEGIFAAADDALYSAKEAGKDRSAIFDPTTATIEVDKTVRFATIPPHYKKANIPTIAKRNKIINNITNALLHREYFIVIGHKDCDEDCFGAAVSFALLLRQLQKEVIVCMNIPQGGRGILLKNVCVYNDVTFLSPQAVNIPNCDTVVICDTPKPDLLDAGPTLKARISDMSILKIELDHHLGADSRYIGNDGYCLVQQATSTCEIVLWLCLKLQQQKESLQRLRIKDVLTRNISLALGIGILTDTQNGRMISKGREKRLFDASLRILDQQLANHTFDDKKATSVTDIMKIDQEQSPLEVSLNKYFMRRVGNEPRLHYIVMYKTDSAYIARLFEHSLVQNASRVLADQLAESSGFFGMTAYIMQSDQDNERPLMQCRIRRNLGYRDLDLRVVLELCEVEDGGGHEGAVGFRFLYYGDRQAREYIDRIIQVLHDQSD